MRVDETGTSSLYNIFDFVLATVYCGIPVISVSTRSCTLMMK